MKIALVSRALLAAALLTGIPVIFFLGRAGHTRGLVLWCLYITLIATALVLSLIAGKK